MNSSRSSRLNGSFNGRHSPHLSTSKTDVANPRTASSLNNSRLSMARQLDDERPLRLSVDKSFHRAAFQRCATSPERKYIRNREQFARGRNFTQTTVRCSVVGLLALSYVGHDLIRDKVHQLWQDNARKRSYSSMISLSTFAVSGEIDFVTFERILHDEKSIDEQSFEKALKMLYKKDRDGPLNSIEYTRLQTDLLEVSDLHMVVLRMIFIQRGDRFTDEEFRVLRNLLGTEQGKINVKQVCLSCLSVCLSYALVVFHFS
jgi:hypothetical protein